MNIRHDSNAVDPDVSHDQVAPLATAHRLGLEAGLSETRQELIFRILNHTIHLCEYDRASLWLNPSATPRIAGVSGMETVPDNAVWVSAWKRWIAHMPADQAPRIWQANELPDEPEWRAYQAKVGAVSILWLPIRVGDSVVAGLCLERWNGRLWQESELRQLASLALSYGIAWRPFGHRKAGVSGRLIRRLSVAAVLLIVAALLSVRIPLRVVAPCEIVPCDPVLVTAPQEGVISELTVEPGDAVADGAVLARYDRRLVEEERNLAAQRVEGLQRELKQLRVSALDDANSRSRVAVLESRLEEEKTRLRVAEHRVGRLTVHAPTAGTVLIRDPQVWRGRPVRIGEQILQLVDPQKTRLRIRIPVRDLIAFDRERPVQVLLASDPGTARRARLVHVNQYPETSADGITVVQAEADWLGPSGADRIGLQGSAVLYGPPVSLGYWLFRKPLAAVRMWLGW